MRNRINKQLKIVEPSIDHEHAKELFEIRSLIDENPLILDLIHADLIRNLDDPEAGREGMTARQVFCVLLIKQMNGFSYKTLQYHLADSRTYRWFCGFGIADVIPSESTLQRDIKKIRFETMEAINRVLLGSAAKKGIEKGRKVRVDCTVTESNIHYPTDSSLLWDCVRVLCRLTQRAKDKYGITVSDHRRRAKRRAMGILNAKRKKQRVKLYRDLLKVTKKIVSIFETHTDIIRKDRRDTYYGHKLAITGGASGLLTDLVVEDGNPSDATIAQKMIARQKDIYKRPPRQAAFDGGFASKDNLKDIKRLGVTDVMFSKKCGLEVSDMAKSTWVYKRLRNFRAGIEGMISFLKRCFGLARCTWRGLESFRTYAWSSVVTANLLLMARRMLA
jgi:IS5 family transposase